MSHQFFTPLRYPGGKAGLGQWIAHLMRQNSISGNLYIEPYAGGCGVALYLLLNGYVDRIEINDADPIIYNFWRSVLYDTKRLIELIEKTEVTVQNWYKQKEITLRPDQHSPLEVGFAAFFLNRTNRSGILTGGIIGGYNQTGKYKIDARFNKKDLIDRIKLISTKRNNINIFNLDALDLIKKHANDNIRNSLIYLDPPYYNKGSQLYRNFYSPEDHAEIATEVKKIKTPWIVTYDNCKPIRDLYSKEQIMEFSLTYSTSAARQSTNELMVCGNLNISKAPEIRKSIRPYPRAWDLVA